MVVGDSITAFAPLPPTVCGIPLLKAGIGGNRVSHALALAEELNGLNPTAMVIAIGINDAQIRFWKNPDRIEQFERNYVTLIKSFHSKISLAGITAIELGKKYSDRYDLPAAEKLNVLIKHTAESINLPFIDISELGPTSTTTVDGVHLTEQANAVWRDRIVAALEAQLGCMQRTPAAQ